jgi:threonine aldolase
LFYVGGTKNGALIGEAIVISNPRLKDHFRFNLRQRGGLLAKGRAVSLQFLELFSRRSLF